MEESKKYWSLGESQDHTDGYYRQGGVYDLLVLSFFFSGMRIKCNGDDVHAWPLTARGGAFPLHPGRLWVYSKVSVLFSLPEVKERNSL